MKSGKIRIILADDHILLRDTLASFINSLDSFDVVAQAGTGKEVIEFLNSGNIPEILLLDLNMPEMNGYETTDFTRKKFPQVNILILTMYDSELALIKLLRMGVKGFLKKDVHPFDLKRALEAVACGKYYYGDQTMDQLTDYVKKSNENQELHRRNLFNESEVEFLRLSSSDFTYKEIANQMNMTARKIDHLRDGLFAKLEVKSRVGLAIYAIRNGLSF